ncbi:MAG: FIST C-terminal domain-containing protein [Anaerolineales bacterium]|nr:FIST C-terminal domain-containing protein [Anaerolineales bacterium]
MTLIASVGQAKALDGREAGLQATHQALNRLGANQPTLGIVFTSQQYEANQVVNGVTSLLSDTPLIGMSTPAGLTNEGLWHHSVVVALLSSPEIEANAHWFSTYAQSSREAAAELEKLLGRKKKTDLLFFADGFNGDAEQLCESILVKNSLLAGGLSSGDLHTGNTYQLSNKQTGNGSLTALTLSGNLQIGIGASHGWNPIGSQFRITRSRGFWIRTLNGRPVSETYAQLFGYPARDWAFPPLSHLARLYPLGIETPNGLMVRSPIRVEADGSFRMGAPIRDGSDAFLLIGNRDACLQAAQQAARQSLAALMGAKPVFALVLADIAWQMLLKDQPGAEISAMQEVLGETLPIAGGYTLGQLIPDNNGALSFLNQHIVVITFAEKTNPL